MKNSTKDVNPTICPLCNKNNHCGNLLTCNSSSSCWCRSPNITFSDSLFEKLPDEAVNKACICKTCALTFI